METESQERRARRRERRRERQRDREDRVRYLDYPVGGYPYYHGSGGVYPSIQALNYQGINPYYNANPVIYNQGIPPFTVVQQPVISPSCSCLTSDVPFSVAHSVKGGVSSQGRPCTPGDDRCFCYDTCKPHLGKTGMGGIGWNCGNKSVNGVMYENSTCNLMHGLKSKF